MCIYIWELVTGGHGGSNGPANFLVSAEPVPCSAASQDQLPNQAAILKLKTAVVHPVLTLRGEQRSPVPCTQYWEDGARGAGSGLVGSLGQLGAGQVIHTAVFVSGQSACPEPRLLHSSPFPFSAPWCEVLICNCTLWSPEELPV